jgi:c-di-GMP-binding flagellar brake protein YcgR
MSTCEKCGRDVKKLTMHAASRMRLCVKCISQSGIVTLSEAELSDSKDERRGSIRVPLTVIMDFAVNGQTGVRKYPAFSVDLSMMGICFVWEACHKCAGYTDGGVHPQCIFYPSYLQNPAHRPLRIEIKVSDNRAITVDAYVAHTTKDKNLGQEYVGAKFCELSNQSRRIIEKMIIMG